jgi:peptide deformylase
MTQLDIVQKGDSILETPAKQIAADEILGTKIQTLISDMKETLDAISDGVGLAAPQVGAPYALFIVSKRVFTKTEKRKKTDTKEKPAGGQETDLVCINPRIIKFSKTKKWLVGEGCLSVRWFYGKVLRSTHVSLEYTDEFGKKQVRGSGGILAHIFQHECDHLDGHLFIDKAIELEWLEPEKIQ